MESRPLRLHVFPTLKPTSWDFIHCSCSGNLATEARLGTLRALVCEIRCVIASGANHLSQVVPIISNQVLRSNIHESRFSTYFMRRLS